MLNFILGKRVPLPDIRRFPTVPTQSCPLNVRCSTEHRYMLGHDDAVLTAFRWRNVENSAAFIKPYLQPGVRVLDCGCGPGSIANDIADRCGRENVIGVDNSSYVLNAAAKSFPDLKLVCGDIMDLPFSDNEFDLVFAHQVIHYLSDPTGALAEMRRVCKPDGVVAVRSGAVDGIRWMPEHVGFKKLREGFEEAFRLMGGHIETPWKLPLHAMRAGPGKVNVSASTWCFSEPEDRKWYGELWLETIQRGRVAEIWEKYGVMGKEDVEEMKEALRLYIDREDGLHIATHLEVVCHKSGKVG